MCIPALSFTRHCFTASEPIQYPDEVALVPSKHRFTASRPVQYPGAVAHTSLIASINILYNSSPLQIVVYIYEFVFELLGVHIEAGWYSESFFVLLRKPQLLCKFQPIGINHIQPIQLLDFNVCRWNPYKGPTKNLKLSHRCIG